MSRIHMQTFSRSRSQDLWPEPYIFKRSNILNILKRFKYVYTSFVNMLVST